MGPNPFWLVSLQEKEICIQREDHVKIWEDSYPQTKEAGPRRNQPYWLVDILLLASKIMRQ